MWWSLLPLALCAAAADVAAKKVPDIPKVGRVSLVQIHGEVDPGLAAFVKRALEGHRAGELVVLEVNTLGGRLDSAIEVRDAVLAAEATTLCWVHPRAISAGALIALSCDVVAVAPGASIGAATPVTVGGGDARVDEKLLSYMRQEMASTARQTGRNAEVAKAMVDGDVVVPGLNRKGELVTLDEVKALEWGVADVQAATLDELWQKLERDPPRIERLHPSAAESLSRFFANPTVAVVLMVLGLFGIVVELLHPKGGLGLLFGLACLAAFFFGHHVVNLAGWEEAILLLVGLALIGIEYFVPGHGVFGVVGAHLVLASLFLALIDFNVPFSVAWESGGVQRALASVFGAVLVTFGLYVAAVRFLPESHLGRKLILQDVVAPPPSDERGIALEALVGQAGVALTDLRPAGRVEVINRRADARLEVGFARAGARVRVLRVEGRSLVVEEIGEESGREGRA